MTRELLVVEGVSKRYTTYRSEAMRFLRWFGFSFRPNSEFVAVDDVSFSLRAGEAVAIIGQNGAGKSTLLKMITGTSRPSTGTITVGGRVSAILELGLGFNPEFTGRENVRHSGGLLGLSGSELTRLIPEIESFSELGRFFDQPVRVYSSGMQARLAFALATALRPELLIVDEVLSVGDSYFQHKSFARIRDFRKQGTTILFVTHSLGDVREICDRVILLDKGRVLKDGAPDEVIDYYNAMIAAKEAESMTIEQKREANGWLVSRSGTREARVENVQLLNAATRAQVHVAKIGDALELVIDALVEKPVKSLVFGVMIRDRTGHVVWGSNTWRSRQILESVESGYKVRFTMYFTCNLGPGSYSITHALTAGNNHAEGNYEWVDNCVVFDVVATGEKDFIGTNSLPFHFEVNCSA